MCRHDEALRNRALDNGCKPAMRQLINVERERERERGEEKKKKKREERRRRREKKKREEEEEEEERRRRRRRRERAYRRGERGDRAKFGAPLLLASQSSML
jgi:hypothetical protein